MRSRSARIVAVGGREQLDLADDLATRLPLTRRALELGRIDLDKG